MHFLLGMGRTLASHACVVERRLEIEDLPLRTGYVEAVVTGPSFQGRGIGSSVMKAVNGFIDANYELGALSTGAHGFYSRLGWEAWTGPSYISTNRGRIRTADADGSIMIFRTSTTPPLDPAAPITAAWRPGELW